MTNLDKEQVLNLEDIKLEDDMMNDLIEVRDENRELMDMHAEYGRDYDESEEEDECLDLQSNSFGAANRSHRMPRQT